MLVEGLKVSSASNIRSVLQTSLLDKHESSLDTLQKRCTMVTDSAAVNTRVSYASVSADIHTPDEPWMGRLAHFQNNVMKHFISICNRNLHLRVVAAEFLCEKDC